MTSKHRVLFVGTGGGNDVFSTTLAIDALWRSGWRWDECAIAGVLSPFHAHTATPCKAFRGVTKTGPADTRTLLRKGDARTIGFVDAAVAKMVAEVGPYGCKNVYGLSLKLGTYGLAASFRALATKYDDIVLVDLGGDIFYGGAADTHVLSPMFDAMVLHAFVMSDVQGCLFEAGPGTDGELEPERIRQALNRAKARAYPLEKETIDAWDALYRRWIEPVRPGRTVPMTIAAYRHTEEFLTLPYRARAHIGGMKKYSLFDQRISTALNRQYFLVDPYMIANPFAVPCVDPYDWFIRTQIMQQRTNCEANLEYYWNPAERELAQFVTPSPLFPEKDRAEIIDVALKEVRDGVADIAWMFPADLPLISEGLLSRFVVIGNDIGGCTVLSPK